MPASSAISANFLLSGQLPDQRSGTSVTARPEEQLTPNKPIWSLLLPCMARRAFNEAEGACTREPLAEFAPSIPENPPVRVADRAAA
jgi:hypothetical protein